MTTLYCAHPTGDYGSANEERRLCDLRRLFPDVECLNPAEMFSDTFDWLSEWPRLCCTLDLVVAWGASDGTVGCGVLRELSDATVYRIPTAILNSAGLWHWGGLDILTPRHRSAKRVGRLRAGRPVSPSKFLASSPWAGVDRAPAGHEDKAEQCGSVLIDPRTAEEVRCLLHDGHSSPHYYEAATHFRSNHPPATRSKKGSYE